MSGRNEELEWDKGGQRGGRDWEGEGDTGKTWAGLVRGWRNWGGEGKGKRKRKRKKKKKEEK